MARGKQQGTARARGLRACAFLLLSCPWATLQAGGCPDLMHIQGDTTIPDLVISAIDPGEWIEVFNPNETSYAFATSAGDFCSPFLYSDLPFLSPSTVVEPHGYARVPWPGAFPDTEAGGQIIFYNVASGHLQENIADFVCWGTGDGGRKFQAEAVGKWIGDCAPAISPGMTIRRLVMTDGITAASYDTNAPPQNCAEGPPFEYGDGFETLVR